jgi:hypothetical protein
MSNERKKQLIERNLFLIELKWLANIHVRMNHEIIMYLIGCSEFYDNVTDKAYENMNAMYAVIDKADAEMKEIETELLLLERNEHGKA